MASAAIVAQPAVASPPLPSIRQIPKRFILVLRRVASGVRWMAARPGLRFSIMRKRWRLAPWRLLLQVRARFTSALVNSIHALTASLASGFIELTMPTPLRRWLVPSTHNRLLATLLTTFLMGARSQRFWSTRLTRRRSGYQPRAALAAVAPMRSARSRSWRRVESFDHRTEL